MIPKPPLSLQTERLTLRQFTVTDYDAYTRLLADPEVMRYVGLGRAMDRSQAWQNLALLMGHWCLRGYGLWALELREQPGLIGRVGLYRPEGWPGLEIGWLLAREHWGLGLATEAAKAVKAVAREHLAELRLISLIHPRNVRSARVAERLGGYHEGQREVLQQTVDVYRYW